MHDLITVDFEKIDIYTGVRIAALIAPLLVIGLVTRHESYLVILGAGYILAIDEIGSRRTSILLTVSVLYASIFAIGMLISMVAADYLVVPLLALGLFFISYFRVFSKGFMTLKFDPRCYFNSYWSGFPTSFLSMDYGRYSLV